MAAGEAASTQPRALPPARAADLGWSAVDTVLLAAVAAVALAVAGMMFADYFRAPDLLWRGAYHDRNGHFNYGADLALALRQFDPIRFLSELEKARVWPPVHGLVLSVVLLFGGIDHRLGILPSLAGWVATVVFVWLIARHLFSDRVAGRFAATVAAVLTAASPAFRLLGSDVMLEGLGAGLSAAALLAYLRASRAPDEASRWRLLALVLTFLFFEKYNYWVLVVVPITISLALEQPRRSLEWGLEILRRLDTRAIAVRAVRDPLVIVALLLGVAFFALQKAGPTWIELFGRKVSLYPPQNILTAAYAFLFIRAVLIWRANRGAIDAALGSRGRMLFYWHAVPLAIAFLIPKRLYDFLWYVGPVHYIPQQTHPLPATVAFYWHAFADGFHVAPWLAVMSVALAALAATQIIRFEPWARAIFLMVVLCTLAVVFHPQHQGRFLTNWVFSVWIAAGAGAGVVLQWLLGRQAVLLRAGAALAAVAALVAANVLQRPSSASYDTAIRATSGPSDIELVRPYLHDLEGAHVINFAATHGFTPLFEWVIKEHCGCRPKIEWIEFSPAASAASAAVARQQALDQISRSQADRLIILVAPDSVRMLPVLGLNPEQVRGLLEAMNVQQRFVRAAAYRIPEHGAEVTVWRPRPQ